MRSSPALATELSLAKLYYKPHIEGIKRQFNDAQELGAAAAEEWIKGLPQRCQQYISAVLLWEQYEAKGEMKRVNAPPPHERWKPDTLKAERLAPTFGSQTVPSAISLPPIISCALAPLSISVGNYGFPMPQKPPVSTLSNLDVKGLYHPARKPFTLLPKQTFSGLPMSNRQCYQHKAKRNVHDVNEAKAARRTDIERRCASLDPPIPQELLYQMTSFQAAIQISQPMTDSAWQMLKPRLLAQIPSTERVLQEPASEARLKDEESKQRQQHIDLFAHSKVGPGREWNILQEAIRNRIGALANKIISNKWSDGKKVTKKTAAIFAADVLVEVRKRFYAETTKKHEVDLASGDIAKAILSKETPTPLLVLANMKWIFEKKLKRLTDHHQREPFLCAKCVSSSRYYDLEGIVQHFAAKHTTQSIVRWRTEWPEYPPFKTYASPTMPHACKEPLSIATPCPDAPSKALARTGNSRSQSSDISSDSSSSTTPGITVSSNTRLMPAPPTTLQSREYPSTRSGEMHQGRRLQQGACDTGTSTLNTTRPGQIPSMYGLRYAVPHIRQDTVPGLGAPAIQGSAQNPFGTSGYQSCFSSTTYYPDVTMIDPPDSTTAARSSYSFEQQIEEMARHAGDVFSELGVQGIPESVKVFATIQHTVTRFKLTYAIEPTLQMFTDGLDHYPDMRSLQCVNGIACKACCKTAITRGDNLQNQGMYAGTQQLHTLPQLLRHFKSAHVEVRQMSGPSQSNVTASHDWKKGMIELPDASLITELAYIPGTTDSQQALLSEAFPDVFVYQHSAFHAAADIRYFPSTSANELNSFVSLPQDPSNKAPQNDQYDPFRPAISYRSAGLISNVNLPTNPKVMSPYPHQEAFTRGGGEEDRSSLLCNVHDELSNGDNSSRNSLNNDHFPSYQDARARGQEASPEPSDHRTKTYATPSSVDRGRQSPLSRTQPVDRFVNGEKAIDRAFPSTGSYPYRDPLDMWWAEAQRSGLYPKSVGKTGIRGHTWKEIDSAKDLVQISDTQARQHHSSSTKDNKTNAQPRLLSQRAHQYHPQLSSYGPTPHRADGSYGPGKPAVGSCTSQSGLRSHRESRVLKDRGRSRSPSGKMQESMLYRTRSPIEEDRGDPMRYARKTISSRNEGAMTDLTYGYPTHNAYQYVNEKDMEPRYQHHVKYLPPTVGESFSSGLAGEHTRYAMARPNECIVQLEYLDYEPPGTREPFYEINGEIVPASQIQFV